MDTAYLGQGRCGDWDLGSAPLCCWLYATCTSCPNNKASIGAFSHQLVFLRPCHGLPHSCRPAWGCLCGVWDQFSQPQQCVLALSWSLVASPSPHEVSAQCTWASVWVRLCPLAHPCSHRAVPVLKDCVLWVKAFSRFLDKNPNFSCGQFQLSGIKGNNGENMKNYLAVWSKAPCPRSLQQGE